MKMAAEDYLLLYEAYKGVEVGQANETTMEQISTVLFCTPRNAKNILNKMIELNWVQFFSGSGRGNKSTITFLLKPEEVILEEAKRLIQNGDMASILSLVRMYKGEVDVKELVINWLNSYFGYQHGLVDALRFPIFRPINTLDPLHVFYDFDAHMVEQIYNTLLIFNPETSKLEGMLAHFWEANEDFTVWRFYLRKGILFHHGRELEAQDVAYTFERFKQPEHECAQVWLMENVKEVTVIDRYIVEVELTSPNTLFAQFVSFTPAAIVPYDRGVEKNIGTGPFKVVRKTNELCVLEAHPAYFQGRAHLDKIEIIRLPKDVIGEVSNELALIVVNTGESALANNPSDWDKTEFFYKGSSLITVNLTKKNRPQCDPLFRKAISLLINRDKMITDLGESRLYPSSSFVYQEDTQSDYSETLQEAELLLKESSYQGENLSMFVYERHAPDAFWLKKELQHFGIHLDIHILSWQDMLLEANRKEADFILFEMTFSHRELSWLEMLKYSCSFMRSHLWAEGKDYLDEKVEQLLRLPSVDDRAVIFTEIETELKEAHAVIFLVHKAISSSFPSKVKGLRFTTRGGIIFKDIWFY